MINRCIILLSLLPSLLCVGQFAYATSFSQQAVFTTDQSLSPANVSFDGKQIVFYSNNSHQHSITLYIARAPRWQPQGFLQLHQQVRKIVSQVIANHQGCVFNAVNSQGITTLYWYQFANRQLYPLLSANSQFKQVQFDWLQQPYLLQNGNVIFIAHFNHSETGVFVMDMHHHHLFNVIVSYDTNPVLHQFTQLSVDNNNFLINAINNDEHSTFAYDGSNALLRLAPLYHNSKLGKSDYLQIGNKAYVMTSIATDKQQSGHYQHYNIVSNIVASGYNLPLVSSGEPSPDTLSPIAQLHNPSVQYHNKVFSFVFSATTEDQPHFDDVYLGILQHDRVRLYTLVGIGHKLDQQVVQSAQLGLVAMHNNTISVLVNFKNGKHAIYLFTLQSTAEAIAAPGDNALFAHNDTVKSA